MRLIDADNLRFSNGLNEDGIVYVPLGEIKSQPTVDAVPVVRCKDCKYDEQCLLQSFVRDNSCDSVPYTKNWFCADGERKEE